MHVLVRTRIGRRLLGTCLVLLLPVAAASWFAINKATTALEGETLSVLRAASDGAEAQLREFLSGVEKTTESLGMEPEIRATLEKTNSSHANIAALFRRVQRRLPEARQLFWMSLDGTVVDSTNPKMTGEEESRARYFEQGRLSFYPGDIVRDETTGELQWIMSAPVHEQGTGRALGVVALEVNPHALSALTTGRRDLDEGSDTQSFRIGNTGETYLVNREGFMLTEARFVPNAILRVKVDTAPVRAALQRGREMLGHYRDYRGVPVSGSSAILRRRGWVLLTEIDFRQAFVPIQRLRDMLIAVELLILVAGGLVVRRFARDIVDPLKLLSDAERALASDQKNDAFVAESQLHPDEIGDFVRKRNIRVRELMDKQEALLREQRERAEAAAELERISYSMVHDMRAPLRAIISLGDLLKAEAADRLTDSERAYIERMRSSSLRMDRLICDMLKYSSLLHGDVALSAVDPSKLWRKLISDNPELLAHASEIQVDAEMPSVKANEPLLRQCFSALLDNAIQYRRPGVTPRISLRAQKGADWVKISVEDNGMGMPAEFQKRVFGLFQKGTNSSHGSGVGLALVRVAIARMGGQVGVTSEEGAGSCFWIELTPADPPQPASSA